MLDRVLRHPVVSVVLTAGGALLALAIPALHMHTVTPGSETFPKTDPRDDVYDEMQKSFPGGSIPAVV